MKFSDRYTYFFCSYVKSSSKAPPDSLVLSDEAGFDDDVHGGEPLAQPHAQPPDAEDVGQHAVPAIISIRTMIKLTALDCVFYNLVKIYKHTLRI